MFTTYSVPAESTHMPNGRWVPEAIVRRTGGLCAPSPPGNATTSPAKFGPLKLERKTASALDVVEAALSTVMDGWVVRGVLFIGATAADPPYEQPVSRTATANRGTKP